MQVHVRELEGGSWDRGYALDKHKIRSVYVGENEWGHAKFETERTEAGEAVYQLKYRYDWEQVNALAQAIVEHVCPYIAQPAVIIPMPASTPRARQPVTAVAQALGQIVQTPVIETVLYKVPGGPRLKDLNTREEKVAALTGKFIVADTFGYVDARPVLLLDDLYDSGATAEAACTALLRCPKVSGVTLVTLTSTV